MLRAFGSEERRDVGKPREGEGESERKRQLTPKGTLITSFGLSLACFLRPSFPPLRPPLITNSRQIPFLFPWPASSFLFSCLRWPVNNLWNLTSTNLSKGYLQPGHPSTKDTKRRRGSRRVVSDIIHPRVAHKGFNIG